MQSSEGKSQTALDAFLVEFRKDWIKGRAAGTHTHHRNGECDRTAAR